MISLRNFNKLYENPNLIPVREGNPYSNQAVDTSSKVKVIKLVDAEISSSERRVYVPGTSYLLRTGELANVVKTRKEVFHGTFGSFVPYLIDLLINNPQMEPGPLLNSLVTIIRISGNPSLSNHESELILRWMHSEEFSYLRNFAKIYRTECGKKGKIDLNTLVLLEDVNTFKPISNYESDGVQTSDESVGLVKLPAVVKAWEAEFTFESRDSAKITDGDGGIGRYKDGILTLQDACFFIRKGRLLLDMKATLKSKAESLVLDFFPLSCLGAVIGLGLTGLYDWVDNFAFDSSCGKSLFEIFTLLGVSFGGYRLLTRPKVYKKDEYYNMNLAFFGIVKDRRFEGLEEILQQ